MKIIFNKTTKLISSIASSIDLIRVSTDWFVTSLRSLCTICFILFIFCLCLKLFYKLTVVLDFHWVAEVAGRNEREEFGIAETLGGVVAFLIGEGLEYKLLF